VAKICFVPFASRDFKNLPEMQNLGRTGHDPYRVGF
jgi:hypothetical protein